MFPWTDDPVTWWSPDPRAIFELDRFHTSESLAHVIRKGVFEITTDRAFPQVMEGCAGPAPGRESTWISAKFIEAYAALHDLGHAHSVECWQNSQLVGGIYGVSIGGFFAGESMFHRVSGASKVAFASCVDRLRERGFLLFDVQVLTAHLSLLGCREISRDDYRARVREALGRSARFV